MGRWRWISVCVLIFLASLTSPAATPTSTVVSTSSSFVTYGDSVGYTATVTGTGFGAITGNVTFRDTAGFTLGTVPVSNVGQYSFGLTTTTTSQYGNVDMVVAELNNDGRPDIAVLNRCGATPACTGNSTVTILKNNGDGTFTQQATLTSGGTGASSITAADLDQDGFMDLVVANTGNNSLTIFFGTGGAQFTAGTTIGTITAPILVRTGVFTSSGRTDLFVLSTSQSQYGVHLNAGSRRFAGATGVNTDTGPIAVAFGDYNRDGITDIAVLTHGVPGQVTAVIDVNYGDAKGNFFGDFVYLAGSSPQDIVTADFNKDGNLDLAVSDQATGQVYILPGTASGVFGSLTGATATPGAHSLIAADFNNDGNMDLAVSDVNTNQIAILQGFGDGSFDKPISSATVQSTGLVQWAFNGVTFNDGGTVSGWFIYDPSTDLFSDWDFITSGGNTTSFPPQNWRPGNSFPNSFTGGSQNGAYQWTINGTQHNFRIHPNGSLKTPGTLPFILGDAFANLECFNCSPFRNFSAGSLVSISSAFSMAAQDMNGDGIPDFVTTGTNVVTLINGTQSVSAVLNSTDLSAGSHNIVADYSGDGNYTPSTSATPASVFVNQAVPNLTADTNMPSAPGNATLVFHAHASFGVGVPSGTVSFVVLDTTVGTVNLDFNGDAFLAVEASTLPPGNLPVSVFYSGDQNFQPTNTSFTQTINAVADLGLTVIAPSTVVAPGQPFTYLVTVSNTGPEDATGTVVHLSLPSGATPMNFPGVCDGLDCFVGFVGKNTSYTLALEFSAAAPGLYTLTANVTNSIEGDTNMSNNVAFATASVNGADLVISSPIAPSTIGGKTAYVVQVTNLGPAVATSVTLTDDLTRYNFVSATPTQGACAYDGILITCSLNDLAVGASTSVTVVVNAPSSGWASNEFHAFSTVPDPVPNNNRANLDPTSKPTYAPVVVTRPSRITVGSGSSVTTGMATAPVATIATPVVAPAAPTTPSTTTLPRIAPVRLNPVPAPAPVTSVQPAVPLVTPQPAPRTMPERLLRKLDRLREQSRY